jgi:hypothetical protein
MLIDEGDVHRVPDMFPNHNEDKVQVLDHQWAIRLE